MSILLNQLHLDNDHVEMFMFAKSQVNVMIDNVTSRLLQIIGSSSPSFLRNDVFLFATIIRAYRLCDDNELIELCLNSKANFRRYETLLNTIVYSQFKTCHYVENVLTRQDPDADHTLAAFGQAINIEKQSTATTIRVAEEQRGTQFSKTLRQNWNSLIDDETLMHCVLLHDLGFDVERVIYEIKTVLTNESVSEMTKAIVSLIFFEIDPSLFYKYCDQRGQRYHAKLYRKLKSLQLKR